MLKTIQNHLESDLHQVQELINTATTSNIPLINQIKKQCIQQPGKKFIRPTLLILCAKASRCFSEYTMELAAMIELIHSATLLHDDVLDKAITRRNKPTTFASFGSTQAILMGDFIYACAFQLIANKAPPEAIQIIADATKIIVEGEVFQLSMQHNINTSISDYFNIISAKTATLFSVGTHTVSLNSPYCQQIKQFGHHFGMVYQITDDMLDIDVCNKELNKKHGNDLQEGKMTLPTILAYKNASLTEKSVIKAVLQQQRPWEDILPIIDSSNALKQCTPYLNQHLEQASESLSALPDSIEKKHLLQLLQQIPRRRH